MFIAKKFRISPIHPPLGHLDPFNLNSGSVYGAVSHLDDGAEAALPKHLCHRCAVEGWWRRDRALDGRAAVAEGPMFD